MDIPETNQLKELPLIAKHYLQPEKVNAYCHAMADILCWLDGFRAGGGVYSPDSIETLRNISDAFKSIQNGQATSCQSHT